MAVSEMSHCLVNKMLVEVRIKLCDFTPYHFAFEFLMMKQELETYAEDRKLIARMKVHQNRNQGL